LQSLRKSYLSNNNIIKKVTELIDNDPMDEEKKKEVAGIWRRMRLKN